MEAMDGGRSGVNDGRGVNEEEESEKVTFEAVRCEVS